MPIHSQLRSDEEEDSLIIESETEADDYDTSILGDSDKEGEDPLQEVNGGQSSKVVRKEFSLKERVKVQTIPRFHWEVSIPLQHSYYSKETHWKTRDIGCSYSPAVGRLHTTKLCYLMYGLYGSGCELWYWGGLFIYFNVY